LFFEDDSASQSRPATRGVVAGTRCPQSTPLRQRLLGWPVSENWPIMSRRPGPGARPRKPGASGKPGPISRFPLYYHSIPTSIPCELPRIAVSGRVLGQGEIGAAIQATSTSKVRRVDVVDCGPRNDRNRTDRDHRKGVIRGGTYAGAPKDRTRDWKSFSLPAIPNGGNGPSRRPGAVDLGRREGPRGGAGPRSLGPPFLGDQKDRQLA
jgi:hypothetical protein